MADSLTTLALYGLLFPVLLLSTGCQDANRGVAIDISFDGAAVIVNGTKFEGALTLPKLEEAIGPCDRKLELQNDVYVWDSYGIYAGTRTGRKVVTDLNVAYANEGLEFSPEKNFAGKVSISENSFGRRTAQGHFLKNGFVENSVPNSCQLSMGRRSILVKHDESNSLINSISFQLQ